jgi:hypothetical protein
MAYQKYTPFNFLAIIAILGAIYCAFNPGGMGFGYFAALILFGFAFVIFISDTLVQAFSEGGLKPILWIEFGIISCFVVFYLLKKY